jgi:hypothetical protein
MRWAEHVAHMGKIINAYTIFVENPGGGDHMGE